ncbi:SDR family NAD(P)-dependent oxidoreductase [Actinomadura yumaensis]|uniref:SDR family NAD(P)-dependent oxidoreductase n=1 Tax=Actinomadura yumaensis TaxID=111807 RepID=A0ABW2CIL6_9ACTN
MATEERLVEYLKRVTADLHDTRLRLRRMEERSEEPVAVVGMACRFPGGVDSPESLWDLVAAGADAIGDFPDDRGWDLDGLYHPDPDHPGTTYTRKGGFVDDADRFDAAFFGISPREAMATSPQQRLLLETSWEAFERAGIDPVSLRGTRTGVYAGTATTGAAAHGGSSRKEAEGYAGNAPSLLSGRVAYTFGLEGPAVTIETACSSALVAMHLAGQALRQGECTLALAGGVTVMATPEVFTGFSRQRGLSPDGRCKAFSAAADGTGWGEGVGVVVLERLSDARRNGHRVLAVIRGSAVNQDGASNGFTAPNGPSQQRVIRQALTQGRLSAAEVDAVEAHGTGTALGDPIEADALIAAYGRNRPPERPLWLGSVKSNIGHTQGAAGVAGVIKMIMAMRRGVLPASLHIDQPTPHVEWGDGAVRLLTEPVPWPDTDRPRRAGVSSFGISGTNAHLILEQAPEPVEAPEPEPESGAVVPWVLSGRSEEALRGQAAALAARMDGSEGWAPVDVGWSLATTRSVFEHRAVVVGSERDELLDGLKALATGEMHPGLVGPGLAAHPDASAPVFVFPGQGSQWAGMGAELLDSSPVFAERIAECERALAPFVDWSLSDVLRGDGAELARVDVVQPVLWATMVSLAAVWASYGVVPSAVIGHSQGEIAAACVAGALSLEDGARIVALRSRALRRLAGGGAMASLGVGVDAAQEFLPEGVAVAAVNGPSSTVVSGPPEQVTAAVARTEAAGYRARLIDVDYASHGPQVDEITDELHQVLAGIEPAPTTEVAFYSTVRAAAIDTATLDTGYWVTNLRERVRFADTIDALLEDGHRIFIEASPHPVLTVGMEETFEQAGTGAVAVPTLRRDHGGREQFVRVVGQAFVAGAHADWTASFAQDPAPRTVDLPTYAFQRQRFWADDDPTVHSGDPAGLGLVSVGHPLLGAAVDVADEDTRLLTGRLSASGGGTGWLNDHRIGDTVLVPGAALVEWALRAADDVGCGGVEELALQAPLVLPASGSVRVQVVVGAAGEDGRREVRVHSVPDLGGDGASEDVRWECHAVGVLSPEPTATPSNGQSDDLGGVWPPAGAQPIDLEGFYERAAAAGYGYGPAFQGVRAVWRDGSDLLAHVELPEDAADPAGFGVHPALLDAALHPALLGGSPETDSEAGVLLPFVWNGVALWAAEATSVRVRLSPRRDGERGVRVVMADAVGAPVLSVDEVVMRPADTERLRAAGRRGAGNLFALEWAPLPASTPDAAAGRGVGEGEWAVVGAEPVATDLVHHPDLDGLVAALDGGAPVPPVVLAAVPSSPDALDMVTDTLALVQAWLAEPRLADARLALVTRGAVAAGTEPDLGGAAVWGLVRSAQTENPDRFVLVDVDDLDDADADASANVDRDAACGVAEAVRRAVEADEPQVAVRGGRLLVPRLARNDDLGEPSDQSGDGSPPLDPEGTVLITGGTGMAGSLVAEHLVRAWGVRRLLLAGRRGPDAPGAAELAERVRELGGEVRFAAADVSDAGAVADLVAGVDPAHPLTGVVHAAGVLDDGVITSQSAERLAGVWAAKAAAAYNLHVATAALPLGLFVLFSSAAGVVGNAGQAGYAAANAFVDALAEQRRTAGLPGLSVAWGLWEQSSAMTGHLAEADHARLARSGFSALRTERALELLDAACRAERSPVVAAGIDVRGRSAAEVPALLRGLAGRPGRRTAASAEAGTGVDGARGRELAVRLARMDEPERLDAVLETVRGCVAVVLGYASPADVRTEAPFKELGLDSLTAVELRNRLSRTTGLRLPATLVFDYPTPRALADHLCAKLVGDAAAATATAPVATAMTDEPVAIVAMACRFPGGAASPEGLWDLVARGVDAMAEFPEDRGWDLDGLFHPDPDHPGTSYAREGAFLDDAAGFDAGFFGINPREALAMDPQQRLLLEVSWELLERAGLDPVSLKGSRTGVYAGVMYHDYASGLSDSGDAKLEGYSMLASAGSAICGRVAYTLGLEGPAVTVDTACSSSLVAMHLAAQALRQGECSLALAGGVTVMATPEVFTGFSRQRGLAPDGRCKPFAAAADGTGWGEGAGLVLLERLSDARRNGHEVLAVLRGSAVNQDGASNGLTAPNGPSQERVIRQALASAGLSSSDVDAVEAHGTGTTLGDPIEAGALLATYGRGRSGGRPLWLGSVKSNIGHTQAAAGVAGVIKTVMAMRNGSLPASLHIDEPSPHVDWESGAVRLLTEPMEWPTDDDRPRRAGVSSFGASGTNAHLILEQAPEPKNEPEDESAPALDGVVVPWVLSARSEEALRGQAAALAAHVSGTDDAPADVGWSLVTSRSVFDHRAVVTGTDRQELLNGLGVLANGHENPEVVRAVANSASVSGSTVFLFSGQGSQRVGMGAGLYERFPVFAGAFDEVCALLEPRLEHPLKDVVFTGIPERDGLLDHTTYAQAGLFALQVGLARLLASLGVVPDAVVGHSVGEIAAAHVAGVFGLEDACRLVAARATLMGGLPSGGAMAAIQATADELTDDLERFAGRVAVAALNTPDSTVVSGPADEVDQLVGVWTGRGRKSKRLAVSHAFHSPLMDPILDEFTDAISDLTYRRPDVPLISNLTGEPAEPEHIATPGYWADHIRRPVRFAPAIAHIAPQAATFLELGPDPVLATAAQHTIGDGSADRPQPLVTATLTQKRSDERAFAHALAQLHTHGADVDWKALFDLDPDSRRRPRNVALPTYAFQHRRFWLDAFNGRGGDPAGLGLASADHALLGAAVELADSGTWLLTGRISARSHRWLGEHVMAATPLAPGAMLVEWALHAADAVGCGGVEELMLQAPLVLPETGGVRVQVVVGPADPDGRRELQIYSRPDENDDDGRANAAWVCHAQGVLSPAEPAPGQLNGSHGPDVVGGAWPPPGARPVAIDGLYERAASAGYEYGPAFQGVRAVWQHGADVLAEVELPEAAGEKKGFGIHPILLDAALHPLLLSMDDAGSGAAWLPFAWNGVTLWASEAGTVRVRLTPQDGAEGDRTVRVAIGDTVGAPVLTADSVVMREASTEHLRAAAGTNRDGSDTDGLFTTRWTPLDTAATGDTGNGDDGDDGAWAFLGSEHMRPQQNGETRPEWLWHDDLAALVTAIEAGAPVPPVVFAEVSAGAGDGGNSGENAAARGLATARRTLALLQDWLAEPHLADARLVLVTRGAVTTGELDGPAAGGDAEAPIALSDAGVWGLVRTAQSENPDRFVLLDLDSGTADATGDGAVRAVWAAIAADEPQLALRSGRAFVPRLTRTGTDDGTLRLPQPERAWHLDAGGTGTLDGIAAVPCPDVLEPLAAGQVRIEVRTAGINFRDVLVSLGMAPGQTGLGSEGAGTVVEVGPGVSGLSVGDRVMGLFEGAFGPVTVADERMVVPDPRGLGLPQRGSRPDRLPDGLVRLGGTGWVEVG